MSIGDNSLPIIGVPRVLQEEDKTKIQREGKMTLVFFPEIFFQFIRKINREHPDLIASMQLAQVNFQDGTAIAFLKEIWGIKDEELPADMPMEKGFAILYAHLNKRAGSRYIDKLAQENAKITLQDKITEGAYRDSSEVGTPLFPSFEELKDKETHEIKYGRKEKK